MVRLSFAVRPSPDVVALLAALPRPATERVTWSRPEQWIVKLRPLGHVPDHLQGALLDAVRDEIAGAPTVVATLGPTTTRLAGQWLAAPVCGLDNLAAAVLDATEHLVPVTHPQAYAAAVVLARGRVPRELAGQPVDGSWRVDAVHLVADRSAPGRPRLVDVGTVPLGGLAPV